MSAFIRLNFLLLVLFLSACTADSGKNQDTIVRRPNVVLILVDDLGWTDLGVYGSDFYRTPNVDSLAAGGIRFTNAYAACTVCSPTRAAIMSGKYPATINCTDWIEGHKFDDKPLEVPDWTMYMDTAEYTLAEAFLDAGYRTAHFGKWHLGEDSVFWPEQQGFEQNTGGYSKGSPNLSEHANGYFPPFGNPRIGDLPEDEYLTERLAREAEDFIQSHAQDNSPFYLNFWLYNVHTPLQAKEEKISYYRERADTTRRHNNPVYAAMVEHMDDAVGRIIRALKNAGVYENTILVFTSDNGGLIGRNQRVTNNWPLRHGKGGTYEGGVRVPLIIFAPWLEGGQVTSQPAISMDLYPTILKIAGIEIPDEIQGRLEGVDLSNTWDDPDTARDLFWHYPHYHTEGATPYSAVRSGEWKLVYFYESESSELYNLARDIGEQHDLSGEYPEKKDELMTKLNTWKQQTGAQLPTRKP